MSARLDTARLDQIIRDNPAKASRIVRQTAFIVQMNAMRYIVQKHIVDTGALLGSIESEEHTGPLDWWVHDGVEYGIYQEYGTYKMAARPFLKPAVEDARAQWIEAWKELMG